MAFRYKYGSSGADTLTGDAGYYNYIWGLAGDDFLYGAELDDRIYGGDGADTFFGYAGQDTLDGGNGNDTFVEGDFNVDSYGAGADTLLGGNGFDFVSYAGSFIGVTVDLALGIGMFGNADGDTYSSIEGIIDSDAADFITGDAGRNWFRSSTGLDYIDGGDGIDAYEFYDGVIFVETPTYVHFMLGGPGGSAPDPTLQGWSITTSPGEALIFTTDFADQFISINDYDVVKNVEVFIGTGYNDIFAGNMLNNVFDGGAFGTESFWGGDDIGRGMDIVRYQFVTAGIYVDLESGETGGEASGDTLSDIEGLVGSNFGDILVGDSAVSALAGMGGDDLVIGRAGDDLLSGGTCTDTVVGEANNDMLHGGAGADVLDGGTGVDTAVYYDSGSIDIDMIKQTYHGSDAEGDWFVGIENVVGGMADDIIRGNNSVNELVGYAGNDEIYGCDGDDTIYGALGMDLEGLIDLDDNCGCLKEDDLWDLYNVVFDKVPTQLYFGLLPAGVEDDDFLSGGNGNDTIYGQDGIDLLLGDVGNDKLYGGLQTDVLLGGEGDDLLEGGSSFDLLLGGAGNDTASYSFSSEGVNVNLAFPWETTGGDASATISDLIRLFNGPIGPGSNNWATALNVGLLTMLDQMMADAGYPGFPDVFLSIENLTGSAFNDTLTGDGLANILDGGLGNDSLNGGLGNDTYVLAAEATGVDSISDGGGTADKITTTISRSLSNYSNIEQLELLGTGTISGTGNSGANVLISWRNAAANALIGLGGDDTYIVGLGDTISEAASSGTDTADFTNYGKPVWVGDNAAWTRGATTLLSGTWTLQTTLANVENYTGTSFGDYLRGTSANNVLRGQGGDDSLVYNGGFDTLDGGANTDTADFSPLAKPIWVDLSGATPTEAWTRGATLIAGTWAPVAELTSIENVIGTAFSDYLKGSTGNNTMTGGNGDDVFVYTGGLDTFSGDGGVDTGDFSGAAKGVWVSLTDAGVEAWTRGGANPNVGAFTVTIADLSSVENLTGSSYADYLSGNSSNNTLIGGAGNDQLVYNGGFDRLDGGADLDMADFSFALRGVWVGLAFAGNEAWMRGGPGPNDGSYSIAIANLDNIENVLGSAYNDELIGNAGGNNLSGFLGSDKITGGVGADVMSGGSGADTFFFNSLNESGTNVLATFDVITDFTVGDKLNLSAIDANSILVDDQAFAIDTDNSFSAGEIRQTQVGGDLYLEFNTDNDSFSNMSIVLANRTTLLTSGDLIA